MEGPVVVAPLTFTIYIILNSMCRLGAALSRRAADEMALRTFVLMRSEMALRSLSWQQEDHCCLVPIRSVDYLGGSMDHCPVMPIGSQFLSQSDVRDRCPTSPVKYVVKNGCECRLERHWNGYQQKAFGVIGVYLRRETHVVGVRIARLRAYWSATSRELNRLKEIKRSVV